MSRRVLGIDVASANWSSIGTAAIDFNDDDKRFIGVYPGVIEWPATALTPQALADVVDRFARDNEVSAVALDGPQGWRSPDTPAGEFGVGRKCESCCYTQGKTGVYPTTYPGNQRPWIEFSIDLFAAPLRKPGVELANASNWTLSGEYGLLECFPTSAWRTSSLRPLPGKGKRPELAPFVESLRTSYSLPSFQVTSHDDLQAVVAALAAVGAVGGPASPIAEGSPSAIISDTTGTRRVEGLIWNVKPLGGVQEAPDVSLAPQIQRTADSSRDAIYVTQRVVDQVNRAGRSQMQIAVSRQLGGTSTRRFAVSLEVGGARYTLIAGDTHVIWRSHQTAETLEAFERLFASLAEHPGLPLSVRTSIIR